MGFNFGKLMDVIFRTIMLVVTRERFWFGRWVE
jgi:hypothetical protein